MSAKPKLRDLDKFTFACPCQWWARTEDGQDVYIRYRFGELSWGIGADRDEAITNSGDHGREVGSDLDGVMETDEMLKHLSDVFEATR